MSHADVAAPPPPAVAAQTRMVEALLRDPACYPHAVDAVEHLETHISHVLLAGGFAYKLKKPLALGFLDYRSLAQRRFYCEEELRLNRRLAPQLYLDVLPIGGSIAAPRIGADGGAVIDYVVRMRRFPQEALFDRLARDGALDVRHVAALAAAVARFHAACARADVDADAAADWGSATHIAAPMRQNFAQLRPLLDAAGELAELERIEQWSCQAHARLATTFEARRRDGRVRECHGDLHLGNVVWLDDTALPFDGIEFNPELRWIDVVSEIAFMVMDLHAHGLAPLAQRFLNDWLEHSGDFAGLALLDYYLVYRAMVRAKIARMRAAQPDIGATARQQALADYRLYIELAQRFCLPRSPALIVMHGRSGSGKSVLAGAICAEIGAIRVRSDVERKRLHGLAPLARSASTTGGGIYDAATTQATYAELARLAGVILDAGRTAVIDAAFLKRDERDLLRAVAARHAVPLLLIACTADEATLAQRVTARQHAASDASEADLQVLKMQAGWQEALDEAAGADEHRLSIDTACLSSADAVARVSAALASQGAGQRQNLDADRR